MIELVNNGIKALETGLRPQRAVLREMRLASDAQNILLKQCQKFAAALDPRPQLSVACKAIAVEERRKKKMEEQALQHSLRETCRC
jgi:hypothetical protein